MRVAGRPADDPSLRVGDGDEVLLDDAPIVARRVLGAVLNRPPGAPIALVHPAHLVATMPLPQAKGGLELLLADADLAARVADPRFPAGQVFRAGRRLRLAGIDLGEVPEGAWRPLAPAEHRRLRLGVRLPPEG